MGVNFSSLTPHVFTRPTKISFHEKRLSIRRMVVKELLKRINVPLGTFDAQYDIENTSVWSLGGQTIFYAKLATFLQLLLSASSFSKIGRKIKMRQRKTPKMLFAPAYFQFFLFLCRTSRRSTGPMKSI